MDCPLLRLPAVLSATGYSRPMLYDHMKRGLFVTPVKLGERAAAWPRNECQAIVYARLAGKSDDEIKALVAELITGRRRIFGEAMAEVMPKAAPVAMPVAAPKAAPAAWTTTV